MSKRLLKAPMAPLPPERYLPYIQTHVACSPQRCFTYCAENSVVYEYSCHCDSRYVGRTSQQLQDRIKQHVPKWLQQQAKRPT